MKPDALFLHIDDLAVESFPTEKSRPFDNVIAGTTLPCEVKEATQSVKYGVTCGSTCEVFACV